MRSEFSKKGGVELVPCAVELGFSPEADGVYVVARVKDRGRRRCCDRVEHRGQDEMLGTGREEILECEERYGQRRKGKSSLRKRLDERDRCLRAVQATTPCGREDSSNARQELTRDITGRPSGTDGGQHSNARATQSRCCASNPDEGVRDCVRVYVCTLGRLQEGGKQEGTRQLQAGTLMCEIVKSSMYRGRWRSTVAVRRCTVLST